MSFIKSGFNSDIAIKEEKQQRQKYGKPIYEYISEILEDYDYDSQIKLNNIYEKLKKKISGLNYGTGRSELKKVIVNDKRRKYVNRSEAEKRDLLFYPYSSDLSIVKKYDKRNSTIKPIYSDSLEEIN